MTKKDYELIAGVISNISIESDMSIDTVKENRLYVADFFAHKLAQENPKFDRAKFLQACGITE